MRRLSLSLLLVTCCILPLTPGCGDDPAPQPAHDAGPLPDAGMPDGGGDGGLPDAGPGDTLPPTVTSSLPAEGATGVYPVEVYYRTTGQAGLAERKVLTVRFSEPMDTSIAQAPLHDLTDTSVPSRTVEGTWSSDGQTLTLTVLQPEEGGGALTGENAYAVDLTGLRDVAGNGLAPGSLGDGRLDFQTGPADPLLNHACGHTLVDGVVAVTAAESPTGTLPRTDQTHKQYEVTLPASGDTFSGYTRLLLAAETRYLLFLDRSVSVSLHDTVDDVAVPSTLEAVPPVCPGITHRLLFTSPVSSRVRASFALSHEKLRFILEESF